MGGKIDGAGNSTLTVHGVEFLRPAEHRVIGDRIVGATWAFAAVMTHGDVSIIDGQTFRVTQRDRPSAVDFVKLPYPGFATDLQRHRNLAQPRVTRMALVCHPFSPLSWRDVDSHAGRVATGSGI